MNTDQPEKKTPAHPDAVSEFAQKIINKIDAFLNPNPEPS